MTRILRLSAAAAAIYAVAGCSAPDCSEKGWDQGPGVCHIPGGPDGGQKLMAGGGASDRYIDAGKMPAMSMMMSGEQDDPDRMSMMPKCGNGVLELGEICDGNCPTSCDTGNTCYAGTLVGSANTCDLRCVLREQDQCRSGDHCCPMGCTSDLDNDCSGSCGDGVVKDPETCEVGSSKPCPTSCDDGDVCTKDMLTGTAEQCNVMCGHMPVTADSKTKDGCCPSGANAAVDADCDAKCGDGIVSTGETCDTASTKGCPKSCDDLDPCTVDTMTGTGCSIVCSHKPITANKDGDGCCLTGATESDDSDCKNECYEDTDCTAKTECVAVTCTGNRCVSKAKTGDCGGGTGTCQADGSCKSKPKCGDGNVDSGEICDGNCASSCDDGNACTKDTTTGAANTCNLVCKHDKIATGGDCGGGNRCDASGKCVAPKCGDGIVDSGEKCDGNCPTSCPPAVEECKANVLVKGANACDVECQPGVQTAGIVCAGGQGACNGYEGYCIKNIWYDSCSTSGGGCGNALKCRPQHNYCTVQCINDSQCGASGSTNGKCLQGWCNRPCDNDGQCDEGQKCLSFDIGKVCRPQPCGASASDDSEKACPLGLQCQMADGAAIWQCVP